MVPEVSRTRRCYQGNRVFFRTHHSTCACWEDTGEGQRRISFQHLHVQQRLVRAG